MISSGVMSSSSWTGNSGGGGAGRLVRMPVPPVRPLLRRTIKRFLRLLPSILLLLFVISLIFVTLMQIAVIHTHRRLQRSGGGQTVGSGGAGLTNSGGSGAAPASAGGGGHAVIGTTSSAAAAALLLAAVANQSAAAHRSRAQRQTGAHSSSTTAKGAPPTHPTPASQSAPGANQPPVAGVKLAANGPMSVAAVKKAEVLRIEALLDKNLPSIEANTQVLQNFVNLGRVRQIIGQFGAGGGQLAAAVRAMNVTALVDRLSAARDQHLNSNRQLQTMFNQTFFDMYSMVANNQSSSVLMNSVVPYVGHNGAGVDSDMMDTTGAVGGGGGSDDEQQNSAHSFAANESSDVFAVDRDYHHNHNNYYYHRNGSVSSSSWPSSTVSAAMNVTPFESKPVCPSVPPNLVGRVVVESHVRIDENMSQIVAKNPELSVGGFWEPMDCYARHRVAVIIPFRDRHQHLSILLYHLHPILRRQLLAYKIYVIEQSGSDTFNKGVLMNAGVREALKENDFHCFVFHDVDLIPEDDRNLYSCPFAPRHMSVAVDKFNYSLPYPDLVGGVLSISKSNFILVNGYSNLYWGWGGEDDDMAYRLKFHNLHIIRPPESIGRYTMIKHNHRPESPNNVRSALLRMAKRRAFRDGLGSVRYRVVFKHNERCYTHIMVEIGHIHKWHFPSPNKLVLHFK